MLSEGPTEREQRVVGEHVAHVSRLADEGVVFLIGRTQTRTPNTMGFAMFWADDEEAARIIMNRDPAIAQGVMTGELFPYKVAFGNVQSFATALAANQG
jgi:uncharacterized protein YciI